MDDINALYMGGGIGATILLGGLSYLWNKWRNSNCSANVAGIQVDFKLSKEIKEQINKQLEEVPEEHKEKFENMVNTIIKHKKILNDKSPVLKPKSINPTTPLPKFKLNADENV